MKRIILTVLMFICFGCNPEQEKSIRPRWVDGYWVCPRCGASFNAGVHDTKYKEGWYVFAVCKNCWRSLKTPEARMPYYRGIYDYNQQFGDQGEAKWVCISNAVMNGL